MNTTIGRVNTILFRVQNSNHKRNHQIRSVIKIGISQKYPNVDMAYCLYYANNGA